MLNSLQVHQVVNDVLKSTFIKVHASYHNVHIRKIEVHNQRIQSNNVESLKLLTIVQNISPNSPWKREYESKVLPLVEVSGPERRNLDETSRALQSK